MAKNAKAMRYAMRRRNYLSSATKLDYQVKDDVETKDEQDVKDGNQHWQLNNDVAVEHDEDIKVSRRGDDDASQQLQ